MKREYDIKKILNNHGLKATPNRISVLEYMLNSTEHPSAEMIKDHLNKLGNSFSIGTIYNILTAFEEKGIIIHVGCDENDFMRYDANTNFHVHILNKETNEVVDYMEDKDLEELENILKKIRKKRNLDENSSIIIEY